ncbi:MAG: DNA helicase RecQ [Coriobacteriia bacterium]|nr:DNA helicase RecQ [Coriobacteriia bacterium]
MPLRATTIDATLAEVFGYREFRPHQREIVEHIIDGGDAFVLMPTGGGKSLCFQIPAMHRPGTAIVVSPLISLMKDQVDALRANGVSAACLNSSLAPEESGAVLRDLRAGAIDLLYVAPERLMLDGFLEMLRTMPISLFAIDEAHCVSQWGHDFRPEYVQLGRLPELFPGIPLIALTATADDQTREDVRERLHLLRAPVFSAGFDRPNIRYTVADKVSAPKQLEHFVAERPGDSGIVYCLSRKRVDEVAARLRKAGVKAAAYHAGLSAAERSRVQDGFLRDDVHVVVATVAFGMGIDKPDVRYVVHYDMPKNIEGYYQETGRAGRDGAPAEALCLYGLQDVVTGRMLIERGSNPEQIRVELHKLQAMTAFAEATTCRRRVLLGYFGERLDQDCGNCDVCLDPPKLFDATIDAQKALSAVYRTGERFGIGHVIDVLRGNTSEKISQWDHDQLSVYGIGKELSRDEWTSVIRQLIHLGYLRQDIAAYSALKLEPRAAELLRGEIVLRLAKPRAKPAAQEPEPGGKRPKRRRGVFGSGVDADGLPIDEELFERLRELRRTIAAEQGKPAYTVFADRSLAEMAARRPSTREELLGCHGVGEAKLERYGDAFLAAIAGE